MRIHSSICVMNFILPACRSNFAEVARITSEPEQAQFLCTHYFLEAEDDTLRHRLPSDSLLVFNYNI
jgi:hypothetical protein